VYCLPAHEAPQGATHLQPRPYQAEDDKKITDAWAAGHRNVLYVLPCGGGKTFISANRTYHHKGYSVAIAHREKLVSQMSCHFAEHGIKHRIFAPRPVINSIIQLHIRKFGKDFYDPSAPCAVGGVDTMISWAKETSKNHHSFMRWAAQVTFWITDEAHHLVRSNKWGKVIALFPHAKGLGVTATPVRADGKGLGAHADGVFHTIIEGPRMRQLINGLPDETGRIRPYLCDYRIFCPPNDLDVSDVAIGADGDYIRGQLAKKTRASTIMGNVIDCYLKFTPGLRGVTFAPDMETALDFSRRFNEAGVPSEIMTAETPTHVRFELTSRLEQGKLLMLVTIDLVAEGFDLPAIEVAIMARKTESYGLYVQQFGRPCRLSPGKTKAVIIDHVNNVLRHGLPDREGIEWTLDRRERSAKKEKDPNAIPMRICCNPVCMSPYSRVDDCCPFCGWVPVPAGRSKPEEVDGCVYELDAATLAAMRGEVAKVDEHPDAVRAWMQRAGHPPVVAMAAAKRQREKQEAQAALREAASWYGGVQAHLGLSDKEAQRKFYHQFGIDVLGAQALGRADAEILTEKVNRVIGRV